MSQGLHKSIKTRAKLYKDYKTGKIDKGVYVNYRNSLTKLIRARKESYYSTQFSRRITNGADIWKVIKPDVGKNCIHDKLATDINELNEFFVNLGKSATKHIPKSNSNNYLQYITPNPKTFILRETNQAEVLMAGLSIASKCSSGFDELSPKLIKSIIHVLVKPLTHIINLSFRTGVVPRKLKIAKIIPVYKNGDKSLPINYRPISLLPTFSKILEKLMLERLMSFINKYNLLSNCQFGFRAKRGCEDAVYNLSNFVSENLDSNIDVAGLFIDVSKAFDSLSHKILLDKLYQYGFRGQSHAWFTSYLADRFQYVSSSNSSSSFKQVTTGIPQGSILGPIMFLFYINDLPNITDLARFVLFADDTTCLIPCSRNLNTSNHINKVTSAISYWFSINCLALNLVKCKCIYFNLRKLANAELPVI